MTIDFGQTSSAHSRANPTTDAAYSCAGKPLAIRASAYFEQRGRETFGYLRHAPSVERRAPATEKFLETICFSGCPRVRVHGDEPNLHSADAEADADRGINWRAALGHEFHAGNFRSI
jgi:hypothetical protein